MEKSKNLRDYRYRILPEEVAKKDLFDFGTHERVAATVHKILTSPENKALTIGLEGSWGSGKSTVVEILRRKLCGEKFHYFYFDAWAHEGDPLRKVFLESFIKSIDVENDANQLQLLENRISNRQTTTRIKSSRRTTQLGKWLYLSALFVPLGVAIISSGGVVGLSNAVFGNDNGMNAMGVVFSLAPLIVLLTNAISSLRSEGGVLHPKNWVFQESESDSEHVSEESEEDERSSIEFEKYFDEVVEIVLSRDPSRKLLGLPRVC